MKTTLITALILFACYIGNAYPHDNPDNWIGQEKRKNEVGQLCCGKGDCTSYPASNVTVAPNGIRFPDGDLVPFNVPAPSVDKQYWKCVWGGEIKCVFAPMGAS